MSKKAARFYTLFFLGIILFLINSQVALAGSWWQITASDTVGSGVWNDTTVTGNSGFASPHGGFSSSSNLCKTCHAVHGAGENSFRLLKDGSTAEGRTQGEGTTPGMGNSMANECMYCHDADSGASSLRPYEMAATGKTVRGEHTLGVATVPDSDINGGSGDLGNLPTGTLGCYNCHSVHGANTINSSTYTSADSLENWNFKILRLDPAGDGSILAKGSGGLTETVWEAELTNPTSGPTAVRTGFCADCHNQNPNWTTTAADTDRPNKRSHPQGRGVDGLMGINDATDIAVAAHNNERQGCRGCHTASDGRGLPGESRFPHQSGGWKLMWDSYTDTSTVALAGAPQRVVPNMDRVCLMCHPVDNQFDSPTSKGYANSSVEEKLCFRCHKQSSFAGAPDVKSQFAKLFRHPTSDTAGLHTDNLNETQAQLGGANRHAECLDCHNTDTVVQGQGQPLRGIWGVTVANGAAGSAPTYTKTTAVSAEYQLCFKCHSSYVAQLGNTTYSGASPIYEYPVGTDLGQEDKALAFNPNNNAFHPVEAAGRNVSSNLNSQLAAAGLSTSSTIKCTDCHNSDDTSATLGPAANSAFKPKGPHGSTSRPVLRANYKLAYTITADTTTYNANNFQLCFLCHDATMLTSGTGGTYKTNFTQGSITSKNLHRRHLLAGALPVSAKRVVCRNCHYNVHSNQEPNNTQYAVFQSGSWTVSASPPAGVKTHMVNFSPDAVELGGTDPITGEPLDKPQWAIWLSYDSVNDVAAGTRACAATCHGGAMSTEYSTYAPASGDDAWTY